MAEVNTTPEQVSTEPSTLNYDDFQNAVENCKKSERCYIVLSDRLSILDMNEDGFFTYGDFESIDHWDLRYSARREAGLHPQRAIYWNANIGELKSYTDLIQKIKEEMAEINYGTEGRAKYRELKDELEVAKKIGKENEGEINVSKVILAGLGVRLFLTRVSPFSLAPND